MRNVLIFDIETGPMPVDQIIIPPFEPPANIKDPAKIAERETAYRRDYIERAALDPLTGQVLAIGYRSWTLDGKYRIIHGLSEKTIIAEFWQDLELAGYPRLVGFNSHSFDLPFLFRRSWAMGIAAPMGVYRGDRYWHDRQTLDLREVWQLGDRMAKGSLDAVCRCLGLGGKEGSGADFAELLKHNTASALEYLKKDLDLTAMLYERLIGKY